MGMQVTIVDAFTRTPGTGNRAGVIFGENELDERRMRQIATAVGASETGFATLTGDEIQLRYFTSEVEIGFCGHATVATLHLLAERGVLPVPSRPTVICPAGRLPVELEAHEGGTRVWVDTPLPPFEPSPLAA